MAEKDAEEVSLKFQQSIAVNMIEAMRDSGTSFATIDARLGKRGGYAKKTLLKLVEGRAGDKGIDFIGPLFWAMGGVVLKFSLTPNPEKESTPNDTE